MKSMSLQLSPPPQTVRKVLSSILQQHSIGTQHEAGLSAEELDPVEVARDVLCIAVELEILAAIGGLEDYSRPAHRPHIALIPPAHVDDTVAAGVDLRRLEQSLDVDLR